MPPAALEEQAATKLLKRISVGHNLDELELYFKTESELQTVVS